jgi:glycosyltransferase involved in cell wall biosynthesis
VTLDGDGQHDPRQIPRLLESFSKDEADLVIGSRFLNDEDSSKVPRYRKMGLKVITGLASNASYKGLTDTQSGFRAYGRRALQMLSVAEDGMGASTEILLKASDKGLRILEVPITINYEKGTSTHNPVSHGIDVLLSTVKHLSIRHPLMFYGLPGLCLLLVSMFFGVWTLGMFRDTRVIETNIALISFAAGMFGLTLMTTAVILWVTTSVVREKNEH